MIAEIENIRNDQERIAEGEENFTITETRAKTKKRTGQNLNEPKNIKMKMCILILKTIVSVSTQNSPVLFLLFFTKESQFLALNFLLENN